MYCGVPDEKNVPVGLAAPVDDQRGEVGGRRDADDGLDALVNGVEDRERRGGARAGGGAGGIDARGNRDVVRGAGTGIETPGLGVGVRIVFPAVPSCTRTSQRGNGCEASRSMRATTSMVMVVLVATDSV